MGLPKDQEETLSETQDLLLPMATYHGVLGVPGTLLSVVVKLNRASDCRTLPARSLIPVVTLRW